MQIATSQKSIQIAVTIATAWALAATSSNAAALGNCVSPVEPDYPSRLIAESDALEWHARMDEYATLSAGYLACLRDYAVEHQNVLTEKEKDDLRRLLDKGINESRRAADKWNEIFGKYQEGKARRY